MATTTMQPATTNLNSEDFAALLNKLDACQEARDWTEGKDLVTVWTTCHRSDWLLWLLGEVAPLNSITNELLICRFAREVVHLTPDPCVLTCIETREAWTRGEVSNEVRAPAMAALEAAAENLLWASIRAAAGATIWAVAGDATRAATAGDATRAAAAGAVAGFAAGAAAGGTAESAAESAARATVWTVTKPAADAHALDRIWSDALTSARDAAWAKQADIIRELVPIPVLA